MFPSSVKCSLIQSNVIYDELTIAVEGDGAGVAERRQGRERIEWTCPHDWILLVNALLARFVC